MYKGYETVGATVFNLLPNHLEDLNLNLTNCDEVGSNVSSVLLLCAKCFYDEDGKKKGKLQEKDTCYDMTEACTFLLDFTWEQLNTGNWKDVGLSWRYLYSFASLFKVLNDLAEQEKSLQEMVRTCDMGLLMGAPVLNNILAKIASCISQEIRKCFPVNLKTSVPVPKKFCKNVTIENKNLVPIEVCPSLELFSREYYLPQKPVLIRDALQDWPALTTKQWSVNYILQVGGCRTVPVEIGSKYTDESWSQKLITLENFVERFILAQDPEGVGYCAQHQLLNQIEELSEDISTPLYCCVGEEEPDVNCWFGPGGTVSPLHFDPKNNCLTQVFGEKYVCLFSPDSTPLLYPHDSHLLDNTSQVDLENPDFEKFPLFREASCLECILKPGDLLYIPKKWWHFVRSLDASFSVSFWW